MTETVELAAWLQALSDEELSRLLAARHVPGQPATFFDLAELLLGDISVSHALERLRADELAELAAGRLDPSAEALALGIAPTTWPSVQQLATPAPAIVEIAPRHDADTALSAERAFTMTTRAGSLVTSLHERPIPLLARGGLPATASRRLIDQLGGTQEEVTDLVAVASAARLVSRQSNTLAASTEAEHWLGMPTAERWQQLRTLWVASLDLATQKMLQRGALDHDELSVVYPRASQALRASLLDVQRIATQLGLLDGSPTPFASEVGAELLARSIPRDINGVYVQPDLSIVAPGPLAPLDDERLRRIAELEQRGLASSYRLSLTSVTRALTRGENEASIVDFLNRISLTGIPQPVAYLVHDAATRFGALRVHAITPDPASDESGARTAIRSSDETLIATLAVDRSLVALGMRRTGQHRIIARPTPEQTLYALIDERYPAVLEDADGKVIPLPSHVVPIPEPSPDPAVARLRGSGFDVGEHERAWVERQLTVAARDRQEMHVRVAVGTDERALRVMPLGVANGRLRARDLDSDVERTLPISAITYVR